MRGFEVVFASFPDFREATSPVYSMALSLSTSKRCFSWIIKIPEDPEGRESVSSRKT